MIKLRKGKPGDVVTDNLSASKLYQFFPLRKHNLKQIHHATKEMPRKNFSQLLHPEINTEEEQKKHMYRSECNKLSITHRFSECYVPKEAKITANKPEMAVSKASEIEKISLKTSKRFTSTLTQRNNPQKKWAQTIIRRKNNGSHGQIIKGLTGSKHQKVLEKVKEIIGKEALTKSIEIPEHNELFVPMGSTIKQRHDRYIKKCNRYEKEKIYLKVKKKKLTVDLLDSNNIRMKTEPEQFSLQVFAADQNVRKSGLYSNNHRKASIPTWNEKNISPWDIESFV